MNQIRHKIVLTDKVLYGAWRTPYDNKTEKQLLKDTCKFFRIKPGSVIMEIK